MDTNDVDTLPRLSLDLGPDSPPEAYAVRRSNRFFAQCLLGMAFASAAGLILWANLSSSAEARFSLLFLLAPLAIALWSSTNFTALSVSYRRQRRHTQHPELATAGLKVLGLFFAGLIATHIAFTVVFGTSYPMRVMFFSPVALEPLLFAGACLGLGFYLFSGLKKVDEAYLKTFTAEDQVLARKLAKTLIRRHIIIVIGFAAALPIVVYATLWLSR